MPQPTRSSNEKRRTRLTRYLAPALQNVDRDQVRRAPYAIAAEIPDAQQNALINHALELGGPPGPVIGRKIASKDGYTVEILLGWERLEAFTHPHAFPRSTSVPIGLIDCNDSEAAFYAIEFAAQDQKAGGLITSPLLYAAAAQTAIEHFSKPGKPWKIQHLANALCIARPTLSNRLRLLKGLCPTARELLQDGRIKAEFAKILLAEHSMPRQENLAKQAAKGMMSTRSLYRLVHPGYEPPKLVAQPRSKAKERLVDIELMQRSLAESFGTQVDIVLDAESQKGFIEMHFQSLSILKGLLEKLERDMDTEHLAKGNLVLQVANADEANALLTELGANTDPILE